MSAIWAALSILAALSSVSFLWLGFREVAGRPRLTAPIRFTATGGEAHLATAAAGGPYALELSVAGTTPIATAECLLGTGTPDPALARTTPRANCPPNLKPARARWTLRQDGVAYASGDIGRLYGTVAEDGYVSRVLGHVALSEGRRYEADLSLEGVSPQYAAARPTFSLVSIANPADGVVSILAYAFGACLTGMLSLGFARQARAMTRRLSA